MKKKCVYKVLIAGDGGVGKTTLINRIVNSTFSIDTKMTIGIQFELLTLNVINPYNTSEEIEVVFQLWDFGGQERFRFMLDAYVTGGRGAFLVYDLTRSSSLGKLEEFAKIVRSEKKDLPIVLLGTKLDKKDEIVDTEDLVLAYSQKIGVLNEFKISSKDGTGLETAFQQMAEIILEYTGAISPPEGTKSIHGSIPQHS